jgi:hypothetical protein
MSMRACIFVDLEIRLRGCGQIRRPALGVADPIAISDGGYSDA